MGSIKTIIIDDEPKAIQVLQRYAEETDLLQVEASFRDPVKALDYLQRNKIDLLFLDINMPKLTGMEFLNVLEQKPKVIFTTAYSEYALESYDHNTVDYLLKPIGFKRFLKAVAKAKSLLVPETPASNPSRAIERDKTIYIKSGPQLHKINTQDILYLEKDGNYLTFHTKTKKILSRQNMKDVFEIVSPTEFIRVHKSYIVSKRHMEIIESHQIGMGSIKIPVGRSYREEVMKMVGNL
ncbi:LytR/AlgR family response regulator transcription factor [Arenibacter amylolyticus]|uniref:LytR/AlgR family response regulator transcription factor n=1 Tax=Arenibacter amylolyticus TaxID=1406873 RepID=UPI000A35FE93|nr:LytTR family DNA-binding domain-containing protein [Arenibacter amylolyticus]